MTLDKIKQKSFNDIAFLLYEQALIQEGVKLDNPAEFTERLNKVIVDDIKIIQFASRE